MRGKKLSLFITILFIPFIMLCNFNMLNKTQTVNEVHKITYASGNNSEGYEVQQVKMFAINMKVKGEYDEKVKSTPLTCKIDVDRMTRLIYIDGETVLGYKYIVYKQPAGELMSPTKKGYTFVQWTNEDGELINEDSIIASTEDYPIYANWNIIVSELTVDPNGGTWSESIGNQTFNLEFEEKKEIEDPTRVGYTFDEWELTGEDSTIEDKTFKMGIEDALLKAQYHPNKYTLTVDPNGGEWNNTSEISKMTIEYDSTTTIALPTRTGYTFTGWTVSNGELNGNKFFMNYTGDVTLTANWVINSYKYIVYHNQQSIDGSAYNKVPDDTETGERNYGTVITPNVKTYTGFTSPSKQNLTIQEDVDPPIKNIINYNYARNRYVLTINPNSGSWNGTTSNSNVSLYYQQTYNIANPTRTGYNFNGWTKTSSDSTLTDRVFKMGLTNTTLTAVWQAKTYTLTYNVNGGNAISPTSKNITYNQTYGTLPTPTRTGYRFLGWYTAASGGTKVDANTIHRTDDNVIIYAHWENTPPVINSVNVVYRNNGSAANGILQNNSETAIVTIRATDAEDGIPQSINLRCTSGRLCSNATVTKVSESYGQAVYHITARNLGASVLEITAVDKGNLTSTAAHQVIYVYGPGGALSDTVKYTNTTYDSGWFEVLDSCYISNFTFTVQFASGHSNSSTVDPDIMIAFGRTESGRIVELYRWSGNMLSNYHASDLIVFNSQTERIRQIIFYTYSPHNSCARSAKITYSIKYDFDYNLINSNYSPISGTVASTLGNVK